jgi:hypothetical protein
VAKLCDPAGQLALVTVVVAAVMGVSASPASARVRVGADNPQAGARSVRIAFRAEARSPDSGIAFLRVTLPAGLDASDFRLVSGPDDWKFSRTPDGYNVGGPPTDVGEDAVYQVVVDRLPDVTRLAFPTLQQYSDGLIERDNPTPVLALAPRRPPAPPPPRRTPPRRTPRSQPPRVERPAEPPPAAALPTQPPAFGSPSASPSREPRATAAPTSDAVSLAANRSRAGTWFGAAVGAAVLLVAPVAMFVWWRRRPPRRVRTHGRSSRR